MNLLIIKRRINLIFIKYIKSFYLYDSLDILTIKSNLAFSNNSKINYIKENNNILFILILLLAKKNKCHSNK